MSPKKNISIIIAIIFLAMAIVFYPALAQETNESNTSTEALEMVETDQDISHEDLNVKDPKILPDSAFYGVKNAWRGFKKVITFNSVKKAELELRYANEKMIEVQKMVEKNKDEKEIKDALDSYAEDIDKIKNRTEKAKEKIKDDPRLGNFIDKFTDSQFKQQKILDKIESDIPQGEIFQKAAEIKEKSLENFGQVLNSFVPVQDMAEQITQVTEKQKGSEFKHFKNLEILKELEDKVPEEAKEAIKRAQDNTFGRMEKYFEAMPEERRDLFKDYVNQTNGNESRHMEIIHDFESREISEPIREAMEEAKEKALRRIEEKMKKLTTEREKEIFLKHLEDGEMKDMRIIKELENNLPPQTIEKIIEIKNKAKLQIKEEFEKIKTAQGQEKFFDEIERFHDVRQLEVLKEIEEVIPEDKKEVFENLKKKAVAEMQNDIEQAKTIQDKVIIMNKLAGDSPEHIQILRDFGPPAEIVNEVMKEQIANLNKKVETAEGLEQLEFFKRKIEEDDKIKTELEAGYPDIFKKIDEKEKILFEDIKPEKATARIREAVNEIILAENEFSALDRITQNEIIQMSPFKVTLNLANQHITKAKEAQNNKLYGQAFGQATAALHKANNARRIIKEISIRQKMHDPKMEQEFYKREFEKRDQLEKKFEEKYQGETMIAPGEFKQTVEINVRIEPDSSKQPTGIKTQEVPSQQPKDDCACVSLWEPVCTADGSTLPNKCTAECKGLEVIKEGQCHEMTKVETKQQPVESGIKPMPADTDNIVPEVKELDDTPEATKSEGSLFQILKRSFRKAF